LAKYSRVSAYDCVEESVEFAAAHVSWTYIQQHTSLNFELNDQDNDIVIRENGNFFIYAQVCFALNHA